MFNQRVIRGDARGWGRRFDELLRGAKFTKFTPRIGKTIPGTIFPLLGAARAAEAWA